MPRIDCACSHSTSFAVVQNPQSGSQWDGLKHFGILDHGIYYNKYEEIHPFTSCELTLDASDAVSKRLRSHWGRWIAGTQKPSIL